MTQFQKRYILASLVVLGCSSTVFAQINTYIKSVSPQAVTEQQPVMLSAKLEMTSDLERVTLYYRQFGETEYKSLEMQMTRDSAFVEIPGKDVSPPFIEVYLSAQTVNGTTETFPLDNPAVTPARITVSAAPAQQSEVIILSPDDGEQIREGETYISLSFVYADTTVDRTKTKIMLNGFDLSPKAVLFGDLMIVPPEAITPEIAQGGANLQVETFDASGTQLSSISRRFAVLTTQQAEELKKSFDGFGNAQLESRKENTKGVSKTYNRLDARAFGNYEEYVKANAVLTLTSEEKPENQPQNRYYLGLDARYVKLGLGDAYPRFPNIIMDGRRVRGYTFDLLLGAFNLNTASGEVARRVDINSVPQTLKRTMTVIRPSFGKGENFQWGFTYLKSKDEFDANQPIVVRPQENAVLGSDFIIAFDSHRIELTGQTALSLSNVDISTKKFTEADIDSAIADSTFSQSDGDDLKKYLPILKHIITPNENLIPINPSGRTSLVYETALALNYFGNFIKGTFLFHGKDYSSTGATTIRKDIKGFNVIDRLRLLENRLFLTASYEQLENNTSGFEIATTTYKTINTSISYFPSARFPNLTVGYGKNNNSNPIDPFDTAGVAQQIALRAINDNTNRYFLQSSYDFSLIGRHTLSFNLDISKKDDNTPRQQDISTFNSLLLISTVHDERLESSFGFSVSSIEFPQTDSLGVITQTSVGYQTFSATGRYKIYQDLLRFTATIAPTFGDFSRFLVESGLVYSITEKQSASLQFQFIANSSSTVSTQASKNDSYISFLYRIDF
ncbi:MAG: hypothetical protein WCT99_12660 [Bacteroidota bacterium]|jgi:hypothetical protein